MHAKQTEAYNAAEVEAGINALKNGNATGLYDIQTELTKRFK